MTPPATECTSLIVDENAILETCEQLTDLGVWPFGRIDPRGWLGNFSSDERPYALHALNRFMFFPDHLVDQLFYAAFHAISNNLTRTTSDYDTGSKVWERFCSEAIVTFVQGESGSPTDSGFLFARKVRKQLGFAESSLLTPGEAVQALLQGCQRPVVFVDDFIGSGDQFFSTWTRPHITSTGTFSFETLVL